MVVIMALQHSVKYILGSIRPSATENTEQSGYYESINVKGSLVEIIKDANIGASSLNSCYCTRNSTTSTYTFNVSGFYYAALTAANYRGIYNLLGSYSATWYLLDPDGNVIQTVANISGTQNGTVGGNSGNKFIAVEPGYQCKVVASFSTLPGTLDDGNPDHHDYANAGLSGTLITVSD